MTQNRYLWAFALVLTALSGPIRAQSPEVLDTDRQIIDFAKRNSELMNNLEYLSDMIGPRLTGSERLQKASQWTLQKMRDYGLDNVHLESWNVPVGWERGKLEARVLEPNGMPIMAAAAAWTPGTHGTVTGPVVLFDAKPDNSDLDRFKGKLHNAILLMSAPSNVIEHPSIDPQYGNRSYSFPNRPNIPSPQQPPPPLLARVGGYSHPGTDETDETALQRGQNNMRDEFFKKEGVAVILADAGKPQMLLNMTGTWTRPALFPRLFVAHEHYAMLYRLIQRNVPVTMQVKIENRFIKGPITVYNTVGEIKGGDKADEVVLCGGHLDSWDLGQGSVDNGTGAMITLETARLIKTLGLKPRRTLRFVLFTGEEEGLIGSKAYVTQHKDEMSKISAVFVHDTGTGMVTGIGLHGNPQVQPVLEQALAVLKDLGVTQYSVPPMGGTDHASFAAVGVPGFWLMQGPADYDLMHHSQSDTFDKAIPENLIQGATVMAICAYNVAQLPDMLPRHASTSP